MLAVVLNQMDRKDKKTTVKNLLADSSYVTRLDVLKAVNFKTSRLSQ